MGGKAGGGGELTFGMKIFPSGGGRVDGGWANFRLVRVKGGGGALPYQLSMEDPGIWAPVMSVATNVRTCLSHNVVLTTSWL